MDISIEQKIDKLIQNELNSNQNQRLIENQQHQTQR